MEASSLQQILTAAAIPLGENEPASASADGEPGPAPTPAQAQVIPKDRMTALRSIARKLRSAPDAEETLQFVVETACAVTGAEAGMLTVTAPTARQVVTGDALGAGPYISVQLRVGGPSFGEIVLTRMSEGQEFDTEDETFAELVAEYVAKAVSAMRMGTVLSRDEQDFVDRIVEELRAPLASSVHVLGVVLGGEAEGELPEEHRRYLDSVVADGTRMLRLVDDLMTIAHLRPPELREMESIPVGPWLASAVEKREADAKDRNIELKMTPPAEPLMLKGVPAQLDVVLDHLIDNALKFSEPGGRIDVTASVVEGAVQLSVADEGMGFDDADANRMTDCYARAINAEAARIPGAGLGLFLVKEIVTNHLGRVWLESVRDQGTQAYVTLPPA